MGDNRWVNETTDVVGNTERHHAEQGNYGYWLTILTLYIFTTSRFNSKVCIVQCTRISTDGAEGMRLWSTVVHL